MIRFLWSAVAAAALASTLQAQGERGRPVILLVHGRGMQDRDTALTRKLWLGALRSGAATLTRQPLIGDDDVRLVWYADVLDARSKEGCDYSANDVRALRDAKEDPDLKQVVSVAGGLFTAIASLGGDGGEGVSELRSLAADASFLGDPRKRCGSEARLGAAIDRARAEGRPVVIVAHSLGSLVAYDYLSTRSDTGLVRKLVTIGSMVGAADLRHLLIGGDSTERFTVPPSVSEWVNVRNANDPLATPLSIAQDIVTSPPADEPDPHEMVGYLRETRTVREILAGWCAAMKTNRPQGCNGITPK